MLKAVKLDHSSPHKRNQNMNQYDTPLSTFDLRNVATQTREQFEPIPAGQYLASVCNAEIRTSRNGTDYVFVRFALSNPEYANRSLAAFFFLWADDNARDLANYKSLRDACCLNPHVGGDCVEFIGRQLVLHVGNRTNKNTGSPENYIQFYAKAPQVTPQPQQQVQPQPMPNFVQPQQTAPTQPSERQMGNINEVPF